MYGNSDIGSGTVGGHFLSFWQMSNCMDMIAV